MTNIDTVQRETRLISSGSPRKETGLAYVGFGGIPELEVAPVAIIKELSVVKLKVLTIIAELLRSLST